MLVDAARRVAPFLQVMILGEWGRALCKKTRLDRISILSLREAFERSIKIGIASRRGER